MTEEKNFPNESYPAPGKKRAKIKLEMYGEEVVEKVVRSSAGSGRVYLPPDWVGCRVKIVRLE